jgi:hypothetical protein
LGYVALNSTRAVHVVGDDLVAVVIETREDAVDVNTEVTLKDVGHQKLMLGDAVRPAAVAGEAVDLGGCVGDGGPGDHGLVGAVEVVHLSGVQGDEAIRHEGLLLE